MPILEAEYGKTAKSETEKKALGIKWRVQSKIEREGVREPRMPA